MSLLLFVPLSMYFTVSLGLERWHWTSPHSEHTRVRRKCFGPNTEPSINIVTSYRTWTQFWPHGFWWVWHGQQLYPFHPKKAQALQPADYTNRMHFANCTLNVAALNQIFDASFCLKPKQRLPEMEYSTPITNMLGRCKFKRKYRSSSPRTVFCQYFGKGWWSFDWVGQAALASQRFPMSTVPAAHIALVAPRCSPWHPASHVVPAWQRNPSFISPNSRAFTWHIR